MKRVLLIGSFGSGNLGDEAARITMSQMLRKRGVAEIVVSHWGGILADLYHSEGMIPFEDLIKNENDVMMTNRFFHAVVITGGGIVGNTFALSRSGNFDLFIDKLKAPLVCVSIGVDHNSMYDEKAIARIKKLVQRADYFSVRDAMDAKVIKDLTGIDVEVTPDIVFGYQNEICPLTKVKFEKDIILTYSAIGQNLGELAVYYGDIIKKIESEGYSVVVAPFTPCAPDLTFINALNDYLGDHRSIELHTLPFMYEAIAQAKLVIGGRLHANVLAAMLNTPFVAVNYHPKVGAFCEEIGSDSYYPKAADKLDKCGYGYSVNELPVEPVVKRALELLQEPISYAPVVSSKVKEINQLLDKITTMFI